ncbi:MAG: long-chain fatty acid--CoA ligase [Microbacteriaceae bacterium]|nr:long-chain fatty acid--CoA ligase [Microbacteriaceae bacterium]
MTIDGIGSWIRRRAVKSRGRDAIVFRDVGTTYDALADRIDALAAGLLARGVAKGDRVAYLGNNHPSFIEVMFATARIGAVFVPLNTRLSVPELEFQLEDCGAEVLVHGAGLDAQATGATTATEIRRIVVVDPVTAPDYAPPSWVEDYESVLAGAGPLESPPETSLDDPSVIIYTSGTTGRPKGAVLTHGNLTWNALNTLVDYDVTSTERTLIISPMFHVAAFGMGVLPTLLKGGALLLQERFVAGEALATIERLRATFISGVPTTYQLMMEDPAWPTADISSLRSMTCGGSAIPKKVIDAYAARGLLFSGGYGMTETSPGVTAMPAHHSAAHIGSSGLAHFFTEYRLRDPATDEVVAPGERGEVEVRGPNVLREYWDRPEATAEAFTEDGWFRTGDIGFADEDGFLTIADRVKDMIISGGENIYSAEVEQAIAAIPGVTGVAVIGVPDERWGEVPHAIVTLAPGHSLAVDGMIAFLRERLAGYKVPRTLEVVAELPRTASGKIQKHLLRAARPRD